jgi:glucokinase
MDPYLAAVDIGGTKVTVSVSGPNGILAKVRQPTQLRGDNTALPLQVDTLIGHVCSRAGIQANTVSAVGVSTASPFTRKDNQMVIVAPNICGGLGWSRSAIPNSWTFVPMEEMLLQRYPRVEIGNDCITAVVAENRFGAGIGEENLVYVTWSTGIGAGAIVDGHLVTGKYNNALHLGHTLMRLDDERSMTEGWQEAANLESYVAGPAIERAYGGGLTTLEVFNRYREGDSQAREVVSAAAKIFARGLINVATLLDTRLFIIGGSVSKDWDVLEPLVLEEFSAGNPFFVDGVEFRRSALDRYLGDMAGLSLVMPEDWIQSWQAGKPWESAPHAENLEGSDV